MHFLEAAENLATDLGYLTDPVILELISKVPSWFLRLGTPAGQADFEQAQDLVMPGAIREFYCRLPLACFLHVAIDGHICSDGFFDDDPNPPSVVQWASGRHIVLAFHPHSGAVCAAAVDVDDPLVTWGYTEEYADEPGPTHPVGRFSEWVYGIVQDYDRQLDQRQKLFENEARQSGMHHWIYKKPGMKARLCRER